MEMKQDSPEEEFPKKKALNICFIGNIWIAGIQERPRPSPFVKTPTWVTVFRRLQEDHYLAKTGGEEDAMILLQTLPTISLIVLNNIWVHRCWTI